MGSDGDRHTRLGWWAVCLVVAMVALTARLLPVLRSGGLFAINQYDAAIYFGSAVGLVHGRLPYRDFLLLHPPGSTLALTPFAALGSWVGDSTAWAIARVAMMALGAVSAVLVVRVLHSLGLVAALLGGLFYAVFLPAVSIEITTRLEPLAAASLLGALVIVSADPDLLQRRPWAAAGAGALLGFATTVKIWGVLPLMVVAVYLAIAVGIGSLARYLAGAAVTGTAICLPFLLAAPAQMWRQVVSDQFGRLEASRSTLERMADVSGLGLLYDRYEQSVVVVLVLAAVLIVAAVVLAVRVVQARLAVVLLAAFVVLLMITPTWFPHYAGLSAGVLAITVGAAVGVIWTSAAVVGRIVTGVLAGLVLATSAAQLTQADFGERFPSRSMAAAVAPLPGCLTADDPGVLLGMKVLGRNLTRGCALVLDLGGYTYDFRPPLARSRDPRWQQLFLGYMGSGTATMKTRYHTGFGLSRATAREFRRWPVIFDAEGFELRRPR